MIHITDNTDKTAPKLKAICQSVGVATREGRDALQRDKRSR